MLPRAKASPLLTLCKEYLHPVGVGSQRRLYAHHRQRCVEVSIVIRYEPNHADDRVCRFSLGSMTSLPPIHRDPFL